MAKKRTNTLRSLSLSLSLPSCKVSKYKNKATRDRHPSASSLERHRKGSQALVLTQRWVGAEVTVEPWQAGTRGVGSALQSPSRRLSPRTESTRCGHCPQVHPVRHSSG